MIHILFFLMFGYLLLRNNIQEERHGLDSLMDISDSAVQDLRYRAAKLHVEIDVLPVICISLLRFKEFGPYTHIILHYLRKYLVIQWEISVRVSNRVEALITERKDVCEHFFRGLNFVSDADHDSMCEGEQVSETSENCLTEQVAVHPGSLGHTIVKRLPVLVLDGLIVRLCKLLIVPLHLFFVNHLNQNVRKEKTV